MTAAGAMTTPKTKSTTTPRIRNGSNSISTTTPSNNNNNNSNNSIRRDTTTTVGGGGGDSSYCSTTTSNYSVTETEEIDSVVAESDTTTRTRDYGDGDDTSISVYNKGKRTSSNKKSKGATSSGGGSNNGNGKKKKSSKSNNKTKTTHSSRLLPKDCCNNDNAVIRSVLSTASTSSVQYTSQAQDCLENSLQILHTSVEQAKEHCAAAGQKTVAYCYNSDNIEQLQSTCCPTTTGATTTTGTTTGATAGSSSPDDNTTNYQWWMSLFQRLQESHVSDRKQWANDLKTAKQQGFRLKRELQSHMEDRLQWLENQLEQENINNGQGSGAAAGGGGSGEGTGSSGSRAAAADNDDRRQDRHHNEAAGGSRASSQSEDDDVENVDRGGGGGEGESRSGRFSRTSGGSSSTDDGGYEVDDEHSRRKGVNGNLVVVEQQTQQLRVDVPPPSTPSNAESNNTLTRPTASLSNTTAGNVVVDEATISVNDNNDQVSMIDPKVLKHQQQAAMEAMAHTKSPTVSQLMLGGVTSDLTDADSLNYHHVHQRRDNGYSHPLPPTGHPPNHTPLSTSSTNLGTVYQYPIHPIMDDNTDASTAASGVELRYDNALILQRLGELERQVTVHEREKNMALKQANRVKVQGEQLTELSETMQEQLIQLMREVETASFKQTKKWKEKVSVQKQLLELLEQQHAAAEENWKHEKDVLENTLSQVKADKVALASDLKKERNLRHKKHHPHQKERERWKHEREVYENTVAQLTADKMQLRQQLRHNNINSGGGGGALDIINLSSSSISPPPSPKRSCLRNSNNASSTSSNSNEILPPIASPRRVEWEDKLDKACIERDMYKQEVGQLKKALEREQRISSSSSSSSNDEEEEVLEDEMGDTPLSKNKKDNKEQDFAKLLKSKQDEWNAETVQQLSVLRDEYTAIIEKLNVQVSAQEKELERVTAAALKNVTATTTATNYSSSSAAPSPLSLRKVSSDIGVDYNNNNTSTAVNIRQGPGYEDLRQLREDAQHLLRTKEKQWKQETERKLKAVRDEYTEVVEDLEKQLIEAQDKNADTTKYRVSVEKRNDLVSRLRALEQKRDEEKGEWKLRLEGALANTRTVEVEREKIQAEYQYAYESWNKEREMFEDQLQRSSGEVLTLQQQIEDDNQRHQEEINELGEQLIDIENELEEAKELHTQESEQWEAMIEAARLGDHDRYEAIEAKHAREVDDLNEELETSKDETRVLIDKTNDLVHSLENLKSSHRQAKEKWEHQLSSVISDKDSQIFKLELKASKLEQELKFNMTKINEGNNEAVTEENTMQKQLTTTCEAVEELRKDVVAVRETLESSAKSESTIAQANHIELSENVNLIQSTLNEAVAELTLGTEAMIDVKNIVTKEREEQTQDGQAAGADSKQDEGEQQQQQSDLLSKLQDSLLKEIGELRSQLSSANIAPNSNSGSAAATVSILQDSMRQDLIAELQKKETELASVKGELEHTKTELDKEKTKLVSCESELQTLNDQADAYSDELMRMHALNTGMEEALKSTELKMEAALQFQRSVGGFEPYDNENDTNDDDSCSPLLDEALALAKGLTNLVHGDQDTDVMDMLRGLSDLMDQSEQQHREQDKQTGQHERRGVWNSPSSPPGQQPSPSDELEEDYKIWLNTSGNKSTIQSPRSAYVRGDISSIASEKPPEPIETPDRDNNNSRRDPNSILGGRTTLQAIVEQLYGRCQILERERTQMMETTLDLLTSARAANTAEMDAAIVTARRKSIEEISRVQKQTQIEKERLYHKLCRNCVKGLNVQPPSLNANASTLTAMTTTSATAVTAATTTSTTTATGGGA